MSQSIFSSIPVQRREALRSEILFLEAVTFADGEPFLREIHAFDSRVKAGVSRGRKTPDKVQQEVSWKRKTKKIGMDELFQIQLNVQRQLSSETNLWLQSLTNDLKERRRAEQLLREYKRHENERLYRSVMEIIVRANEERFMVRNMCDALDKIMEYHFRDKLEAGRQEGKENSLLELISKKLVKGKTLTQIAEELETTEEAILPLYNKAKAALGMA